MITITTTSRPRYTLYTFPVVNLKKCLLRMFKKLLSIWYIYVKIFFKNMRIFMCVSYKRLYFFAVN